MAPTPGVAGKMSNAVRRRGMALLCGMHLYRFTLAGSAPREFARNLAIRWPGDAKRGTALLAGDFHLAGETLRIGAPYAAPVLASADFLAEFHSFSWLADLATLGSVEAREMGRTAIATWIADNATWHNVAWRCEILAARLVAWVTQFESFFAAGGDDRLRDGLLSSVARQARHLTRVAAWEAEGAARLHAIKGSILAGIALGVGERRIARAIADLARELPLQVLPDGGHVERSPAVQLTVLRDLVDVRTALRTAHVVVPDALQMAIDRMAPMLRLFRHGDGRLAQFNDTSEEYGALADLLLTRSEVRARPPASAPHSGFQRLQCGKTIVIADTGAPPPRGLDRHAHAGTLSFEMSVGRERLIVNCGAYRGASRDWRHAARNTAAHSTLIVADTNSAELLDDLTIGHRPTVADVERAETEGSQWIAAAHDGYMAQFGLSHARQLFLAADGEDLRGEDTLTGKTGAGFAIRFHLHPTVQVSLLRDRGAALLRLAGGTGFRLRAHGAQMSLADSIYLGSGEIKKTQQIVLAGQVGSRPDGSAGATVKWAIRREGKKAAEE
jgi:uncharacterized heparinase superfamily protein